MKIYPSINEDPESEKRVLEVSSGTELFSYCGLRKDLPIHVHPSTGTPDLSVVAIHLFPDAFNDPEGRYFRS